MTGFIQSGRFGAAAFAPTDIAGCVAWYDAADTATITSSGGAVSQWNDKSGSGWHVTQSTAGEKPTTNSNTQNSLNVISFDGGDLLRYGSTTTVSATDYSIFMAFKKTGAALGYEAPPVTLTNGANAAPFDAYNSLRYGYGASSFVDISTYTTFGVLLERSTASSLAEYNNGTLGYTGSGSQNNTSQKVTVGSRGDSFTHLRGDVAEIIIYNASLSNANANTVGSYLATKWGTSWATIT